MSEKLVDWSLFNYLGSIYRSKLKGQEILRSMQEMYERMYPFLNKVQKENHTLYGMLLVQKKHMDDGQLKRFRACEYPNIFDASAIALRDAARDHQEEKLEALRGTKDD